MAPASGLAIWHIDDGLPISGSRELRFDTNNNNEKHKRVDLECADGLYDNGGFGTPGNSKNSISGGDNLDHLSTDSTYTADNNGNLGDATDLWTSSKEFTPDSNPSTAGYSDNDTLPGVSGVQPPPGAPTGLTATPGIRQATLTWTGPTHTSITEWQYKRGQILEPITAWAGWRSISTAAPTRTFTVREPLVDGQSYRFEVRARNGGGWSATTRTDTVTLPVDTRGRVALSTTTPQVGDALTATLTDPDNPTDVRFGWSFHRPAGVSGANGDVALSASLSSMFYRERWLYGPCP